MTTSTLPLIGLAGRKRHGKSRTADILAARLGYRSIVFSDPLRDSLAATNPIVGYEPVGPYKVEPVHFADAIEALGYELAKDRYPEFRRLMEAYGTLAVRDVLGTEYGLDELLGASPWVALADRRIRAALSHIQMEPVNLRGGQGYHRPVHHWRHPLAVADVRFPNEADLIRSHGGIIVRVVRPALARPVDEPLPETALDGYAVDYIVENDGTPRGLELAVESLVRELT